MNSSPTSTPTNSEHAGTPLAGGEVLSIAHPGKTDLSDWVELMEAVEALCPVWPVVSRDEGGCYRL